MTDRPAVFNIKIPKLPPIERMALALSGPALWVGAGITGCAIYFGVWPRELDAMRLQALVYGFWILLGLMGFVVIALAAGIQSLSLRIGKVFDADIDLGHDNEPSPNDRRGRERRDGREPDCPPPPRPQHRDHGPPPMPRRQERAQDADDDLFRDDGSQRPV